jgi:hypothetical protein
MNGEDDGRIGAKFRFVREFEISPARDGNRQYA